MQWSLMKTKHYFNKIETTFGIPKYLIKKLVNKPKNVTRYYQLSLLGSLRSVPSFRYPAVNVISPFQDQYKFQKDSNFPPFYSWLKQH